MEKDVEKREIQLEVLCAILASMGSSLSDPTVWNEDNRLVIENVFEQLERLSTDATHLSLRIRCLIRDVLDLRIAEWKLGIIFTTCIPVPSMPMNYQHVDFIIYTYPYLVRPIPLKRIFQNCQHLASWLTPAVGKRRPAS